MKQFVLLTLITCILSHSLCAMSFRSTLSANSCNEAPFTTQASAIISQKKKIVEKKLTSVKNSNVYNKVAISKYLQSNDLIIQDMKAFIREMDRKEEKGKNLSEKEESLASVYKKDIEVYKKQQYHWTEVKNQLDKDALNSKKDYEDYIAKYNKKQKDYLRNKKPKKRSVLVENNRKIFPCQIDGSFISNKQVPQDQPAAIATIKPTRTFCTIS